jgi:hypothetical protein
MSALIETSLTSMKTAFPTAPNPVQGILMLQSLIELMLHMCRCAQTHKTPASKDMNMLFCAAAPDLYAFFTKEAYLREFFPFPKEVEELPDFKNCMDDNQRETLKSTHALAKKTRADIVTMNAALLDVFLANPPKLIRDGYNPICMGLPNTVFLHMFDWFIKKYGVMMAEEREENQQQMAANWQPTNSFEQLIMRLFLGMSYASAARYPMEECNIINIGLRVIKCCGMYAEEYKVWIGIKNAGQLVLPCVKQTLDYFKGFWSNAITLINQTGVPALQHGYGMAAMDDDGGSIALYSKSLENFGAAYAAMQEMVKSRLTAYLPSKHNWRGFSSSAWPLDNSSHHPTTSTTPLDSNNIVTTTARIIVEAEGVAASMEMAAATRNNQPRTKANKVVAVGLCVPPHPTSGGRIGTTATCMAVTLKMPT